MPHKQVAGGQPLLPRHQLHLKQQHCAARDTPGWREGGQKESVPIRPGSEPSVLPSPHASVSPTGHTGCLQNHWEGFPHSSHQPPRPKAGGGKGPSLPLTSALSVRQVRGHHELPPLSHTHALQARVQAFDHLIGPQGSLLGVPVVVAGAGGGEQIPSSAPILVPGRFTPQGAQPSPFPSHFRCPPHTAERGTDSSEMGRPPRLAAAPEV